MKKTYQYILFACSAACLFLSGCKKNSNVWDDSKSSSSYGYNNAKSLWGNDEGVADQFQTSNEEDFIPLREEDLKPQFADGAIPQPKNSPGEEGSGLPGIDKFQDPSGSFAAIFRNVYFNTDDHILRGKEHLETIQRIADYLKQHPQTYIFISGHCDERGPEAYNLALGSRRANYVRTLLVRLGVDLNQIHTISYGKEKPVDLGHTAAAWSKNRRAEFKIYQKQ